MTSRQPIIDIIELLFNLIASVSHLQELIDSEEDINKKEEYQNQLYELVDMRRAIMKEIEYKNKDLRCLLKHSIAQRGYAIEVLYAERTDFWVQVVDGLTKQLYKTISNYMGLDIVDCGRCLADQIALDINKKDEGTTEL